MFYIGSEELSVEPLSGLSKIPLIWRSPLISYLRASVELVKKSPRVVPNYVFQLFRYFLWAATLKYLRRKSNSTVANHWNASIEYPCSVCQFLSLWFFRVRVCVEFSSAQSTVMTSSECYELIRRGVELEVPGLDVYYDKVVHQLRGASVLRLINCVWSLAFSAV